MSTYTWKCQVCAGTLEAAIPVGEYVKHPPAFFHCSKQMELASLVVGLLPGSGPAAVAGLIVPVVVDTVERSADRPFAHVGQEVDEDKPTFTDLDASAMPIAGVVGASSATLEHGRPGAISGRGEAANACAVRKRPRPDLRGQLFLETSATSGVSGSEQARAAQEQGAASAAAVPEPTGAVFFVAARYDGEATEALSNQVFRGGHD